MKASCPKCGNKVLDYRGGCPVPVPWICHECGLTAESGSYHDAATGKQVPIPLAMLQGTKRRYAERGRWDEK